jgi:hypothetical protein
MTDKPEIKAVVQTGKPEPVDEKWIVVKGERMTIREYWKREKLNG